MARLASDEFVVVIPNAAQYAPEALARRLLQAIAVPVEHKGMAINVSASIGIARWGDHVLSAGDLLRDASAAMNYAKLEGRNRTVTFEDRVANELTRRLDSHSFVRHVVRSGALRLEFQPLWSLFQEFGSYRVVYAAANLLSLTHRQPPLPVMPLSVSDCARVEEALAKLSELDGLPAATP